MTDFTSMNRLRLKTMLKEHGLDRPLDEHELALQLLDTELRLERDEADIAALIDMLQGQGLCLSEHNYEGRL